MSKRRGTRRYTGGLRVDSLVSGDRDVLRIRRALVSTGTARTILSPRLAKRVTDERGPRACTAAAWAGGEVCGAQAQVHVVVDHCRAATIKAIVSPLPKGVDLVVGGDVLRRVVDHIEFGPPAPVVVCKNGRTGRASLGAAPQVPQRSGRGAAVDLALAALRALVRPGS